jgi:hypothetical protein
MEAQKDKITKIILSKKSNTGGITIPVFKYVTQFTVTKTAQCNHKDTKI